MLFFLSLILVFQLIILTGLFLPYEFQFVFSDCLPPAVFTTPAF